jgi:FKBP-type peptidyl-prolyl cis-trans isomerase
MQPDFYTKMKRTIIAVAAVCCALSTTAQTSKHSSARKGNSLPATPAAVALKSNLDSVSYFYGLSLARNMRDKGITRLNYELLVRGFKNAFLNNDTLRDEKLIQTTINLAVTAAMKIKYAQNILQSKQFLDSNSRLGVVKVTQSGLQYQVLAPGSGPKPGPNDKVLVHYRGTLLDGKQFDSSYDRNAPWETAVTKVIAGWREGLQLMQTGAKYKFFVPWELAYGERGFTNLIPPFSALIFEVELLKIL